MSRMSNSIFHHIFHHIFHYKENAMMNSQLNRVTIIGGMIVGIAMIASTPAPAAEINFTTAKTADWADAAPVGPTNNVLKIAHSLDANQPSNIGVEYMTKQAIDIPVGTYTMSFDVFWEDPILKSTESSDFTGREELAMIRTDNSHTSSFQNQYGQPTTDWRRRTDTFTVTDLENDDWQGRLSFSGNVFAGKNAESFTYFLDNITIVNNDTGATLFSEDFESDTPGEAPEDWRLRGGGTAADTFEVVVIPEPASAMLITTGLALIVARHRR